MHGEHARFIELQAEVKKLVEEQTQLNILKHELVPQHVILNEEEKKVVFEKFNISQTQLPKILYNDAVVKLIEAKPGDVIKITRKSQTAGTAVYYRLVIKKKI
ncbi:MAG: DNA-directed RNA polymerase subunit H [Candidatus Aenigmarchaeota archaeon]|nr:DNA-directed RNA polymerase subunit H [Candidatus Aenigmarchaeota archaeon]